MKHVPYAFFLSLILIGCGPSGQPVPRAPLPSVTSALTDVRSASNSPTASIQVAPTSAAPQSSPSPTPAPISSLPAAFKKFLSNVQVSVEGDTVILKSNGLPPHPSPYFARGDANYQAYSGSNPNYRQNPNQIREQSITYSLPLNPRRADRHSPTPLGPIGIAMDGVALFNQYAGPNQPLTNEINSFDQFNGHPQQEGLYHYHVEPLFLTARFGRESLIGFLLDGFPVYGTLEGGEAIADKDLDEYHGHSHATAEYPNGIYHYHVTSTAPYINGIGFYGTAGRVTIGR